MAAHRAAALAEDEPALHVEWSDRDRNKPEPTVCTI
jgi:hypothetical protein